MLNAEGCSENAEREMAKAKVGAAGIEYISGALKRPKKQNGHNHGNYLVATHRVAETTSNSCQRLYTFDSDRYDRTKAPSAAETIQRTKFGAVAAAVTARMHDLSQISRDQAAFKAQYATGYKTMRSYLWSLESEKYDEAQG